MTFLDWLGLGLLLTTLLGAQLNAADPPLTPAPDPRVGAPLSDLTLENSAREASKGTLPGQLKLRVKDGWLFVEGPVRSPAERAQVLRFLRQMPGCLGVVDQMTLAS